MLLRKHAYSIDMIVSDQTESVGCLRGMDLLQKFKCQFDILEGIVTIGDMRLPQKRETHAKTITRVRLTEDVTVLARCEFVLTGKAEGLKRNIPSVYSCVEPSPTAIKLRKHDIANPQ